MSKPDFVPKNLGEPKKIKDRVKVFFGPNIDNRVL